MQKQKNNTKFTIFIIRRSANLSRTILIFLYFETYGIPNNCLDSYLFERYIITTIQ